MPSISADDLEAEIQRVRAATENPTHGIFGPSSVSWRIGRDSVVFLGAGRAALLQLAHPYVAHAIDQHSSTRRDPMGRFTRTFLHIYGMIFGDLETAIASARRVRKIHDRVEGSVDEDIGRLARGHAYSANEASALLWVFATLVETSVMAYELGFGPLLPEDRERYYQESRAFARLFGLGDRDVPRDWTAFKAYVAAMFAGNDLAVGRPARETAAFLLAPPSLVLEPATRCYRAITAGLLPARLRDAYGLSFGRADELVSTSTLRAFRAGWPRLPERLRLRPEYVEAMRRIEGDPRPDRFGRWLHAVVLARISPPVRVTTGAGERFHQAMRSGSTVTAMCTRCAV